jgi:hypothetical protein
MDELQLYELGRPGPRETVALFQKLIDSGTVRKVEPRFSLFALMLIQTGKCRPGFSCLD